VRCYSWSGSWLYRSGINSWGSPGGPTSGAECVCVTAHQTWIARFLFRASIARSIRYTEGATSTGPKR